MANFKASCFSKLSSPKGLPEIKIISTANYEESKIIVEKNKKILEKLKREKNISD